MPTLPERARTALLDFLDVPTGLHPPAGDPRQTRVFRAAPAYFRYKLVLWALAQGGALVGLVVGLVVAQMVAAQAGSETLAFWIAVAETFGVLAFLANLLVSLAVLRLDFEQRWYAVTDRALRIREGILTVREQTLTFANVQQVGVRQGPLQRLLGVADVHVSTAGGGGGATKGEHGALGANLHEGYLRGVADAPAIRDLIRERVRQHRDAGLGDPDDARAAAPPALAAVAALHDEVRALGRVLRAGRPAGG